MIRVESRKGAKPPPQYNDIKMHALQLNQRHFILTKMLNVCKQNDLRLTVTLFIT